MQRSGGTLVLQSETTVVGQPLFSYEPAQPVASSGPLDEERKRLDAAALRSLGIPERAVYQEDSAGSYALPTCIGDFWRPIVKGS